jgi:hypothetical protein
MKSKSLLKILFALVLLLGVFVALDEWRSRQNEKKEDASRSLFHLKVSDIRGVELLKGSGAVKLQKKEQGWSVENKFVGDGNAIETWLSDLLKEKFEKKVISGDQVYSDSEFGFEKPLAQITLETSDPENKVRFDVGSRKNFEGRHYLRFKDKKDVYLVREDWAQHAGKSIFHFRDKRLTREDLSKVTGLRYTVGRTKYEFIQKDSRWTLTGKSWEIDQNKVREVLRKFSENEITEFLSEGALSKDQKETFQMSRPVFSWSLKREGQIDLSFDFFKSKAGVVAVMNRGAQEFSRISPMSLDIFQIKSIDDFRDKISPFRFSRNDLKEIQLKNLSTSKSRGVTEASPDWNSVRDALSALQVESFSAPKTEMVYELILSSQAGELLKLQISSKVSEMKSGEKTEFYVVQSSALPGEFLKVLADDLKDLKLEEL